MSKEAELKGLLEPIVTGLGCLFWGMEFRNQGKHSLLRVFIEKDEGVTVDDCERVSRQISAVLDVEDSIKSEYTLEVSSPGWDRPLFDINQYEAFLGQTLSIKLQAPFDGRRNYKGRLVSVEDDEIIIQVDQEEFVFPIELIEKANIVPN